MADSKKVSALTEITADVVNDADLLYIVDVSQASATDKPKKIKISTLKTIASGGLAGRSEYPAYSAGTTYNSADGDIFVSYQGSVWQYVKSGTSTGVAPGTDASVWTEVTVANRAVTFESDELQLNQVLSNLVFTGNL